MKTRFDSVLEALAWFRRTACEGLPDGLRAFCPEERIHCSPSRERGGLLAEAALTQMRIARVLQTLDESERAILFGNDHRRLRLPSRNALYKRQHAIRRRLTPVFVAADLLTETCESSHRGYTP
jgi:hypothetical protein